MASKQSPKRPTWAAYDVETLRLSHEVAGGWENTFDFGFSVGCITDHNGRKYAYNSHFMPDARERLVQQLRTYDSIVSFNGIRFDNKVVAADEPAFLAEIDERSWDVKVLLEQACGIDDKEGPHIISLNSAAFATLGSHKMEGFTDGREAVRAWRRGEYKRVEEYNQKDADLTAEVYSFGLRNGYALFAPSRFPLLFNGKADLVVKATALWKPR